MSRSTASEVTLLLEEWRAGRAEAFDRLLPLVYEELRAIAGRRLRQEREGHTLQTTALVHEAYLKLTGKRRAQIRDRAHFFAIAAQAMRRVLVDHARKKRTEKRGERRLVPLDSAALEALAAPFSVDADELLALHRALERLEALDERQAKVVELLYFGGLTAPETAVAIGVSEATVHREWRAAKLWLRREMRRGSELG